MFARGCPGGMSHLQCRHSGGGGCRRRRRRAVLSPCGSAVALRAVGRVPGTTTTSLLTSSAALRAQADERVSSSRTAVPAVLLRLVSPPEQPPMSCMATAARRGAQPTPQMAALEPRGAVFRVWGAHPPCDPESKLGNASGSNAEGQRRGAGKSLTRFLRPPARMSNSPCVCALGRLVCFLVSSIVAQSARVVPELHMA